MNSYTYDPHGGDLGRAKNRTRIEVIPLVVEVVAEIFSILSNEIAKPLCYCIEFDSAYKDTVLSMLKDIERRGLPERVFFYKISDQMVFDVRGPSGGIVLSSVFYLVTK